MVAVTMTVVLMALFPGGALADDDADDLEDLATWMVGSFSNAVQAAENPEFFDIALHVAPIWPEQTDGYWLYVEQAVSENVDRPYRQRVYHVRELVPGLFECQVFTLPDPTTVIGAWLAVEPLSNLEPGDLTEREGCAILLRRRGDTFVGSTLATLCTSSIRGAAYATSEVVVTPDGVISWDRGFAADGSQVWGAVNGGYVLDRIVPDEEESSPEFAPAPAPDSNSNSEDESTDSGGWR